MSRFSVGRAIQALNATIEHQRHQSASSSNRRAHTCDVNAGTLASAHVKPSGRACDSVSLCAVLLLACLAPVSATANAYAQMCGWRQFATFCHLIERAQLVDVFAQQTPVTIFAPTELAFERMDEAVLDRLERAENLNQLRALLLYHLVPGRITVFDMTREEPRATLQGKNVKSLLMSGKMMINDAFIDIEDIETASGFVHGIDQVLMPPPQAGTQNDLKQ